ncbi:hypothetical protein HDE_01615 [Halotydeus destructor]|nr:hypothetical protein HDE_01615 [Halotydeus destructor]
MTTVIGFLIISMYYSNFMLAQIVRQEKPDVLEHFLDILRPEASVHFSPENEVYNEIHRSKKPEIMAVVRKIKYSKMEDMMLKQGVTGFYKLIYGSRRKIFGLFGNYNQMRHTRMLACSMMARHAAVDTVSDQDEYSIWVPTDSPQEYLLGITFNKRLDRTTRDSLDVAILRHAEQARANFKIGVTIVMYEKCREKYRFYILISDKATMSKFCHIFRCISGSEEQRYVRLRKERQKILVRVVSQFYPQMMMNSSDPSDCKIDGVTGNQVTIFPKILGFNCTAFVDVIGRPTSSGNHTGIIGQLQNDVADMSAVPFRFPLRDDPVYVGNTVVSDSITFTTVYKRPEPSRADIDLLESFFHIDWQSWLCIALLLLLTFSVGKLQRHKGAIWNVIQCFLQHMGKQANTLSSRLLGLAMLFGFFVLWMFYSNFMLSQIVRQEKPDVLEHFMDILRPEARVIFSPENQIYSEVCSSTIPGIEKVANKIKDKKIEDIMLVEGFDSFSKVVYGSRRELFGLFGNYNQMRNTRILACAMISQAIAMDPIPDKEKYSVWVPLASPQQYLLAMAFNKRLDTTTRDALDLAALKHAEQGLFGTQYFKHTVTLIRDQWFPNKIARFGEMRMLTSKPIKRSECFDRITFAKRIKTNGLRDSVWCNISVHSAPAAKASMSDNCRVFRCLNGENEKRYVRLKEERKKTLVRLVAQHFAQMLVDSDDPSDCRIDGILGNLVPMFASILGFNCTAVTVKTSEPSSIGNHTGIIGRLQADMADISAIPFEMALEDDPVHVGNVVVSDSITFTTVYIRPKPTTTDIDLIESFKHIDWYSWLCLLFLISVICMISKFQGRRDAILNVVRCFLQHMGRHCDTASSRLLGWAMIFGFFVISMYYSNFMLSEIVKKEEANVLEHFMDILRPEAKVFFSPENRVYSEIRRSTNTEMKRVFNKIKDRRLQDMMLGDDVTSFSDLLYTSRRELFGLFGNYNQLRHTRILGCAMMDRAMPINSVPDEDEYSLWVPTDSPQSYLLAIPFNKRLDKVAREALDLAALKYAEQGADRARYARIKVERKKTLVRVVSQYFPQMMVNSSDPWNCRIEGLTGHQVPLFAKVLGFNCTAFVVKAEDPTPLGNHTGIIGRLQADMADISAGSFAMTQEGDPVYVGNVVVSDSIAFTTVYVIPKPMITDIDLVESFKQIDVQSWICLLFLLSLICLIVKLQGQKGAILKVIQCFLQHMGQQGDSCSSRLLGYTMLSGFFVISLYYSNFMLTQIVKREKAEVLKDFMDILRPEAKIFFSPENRVYSELQRSTNTDMKKVFHKIKHTRLQDMMLGEGMNGFIGLLYGSRRELFGLFGNYNQMRHSRTLGCAILSQAALVDPFSDKDQYAIWVPTDSPQSYLQAIPFNKRLDKVTRDALDLAVLRYAEQGMYGTEFFKQTTSLIRDRFFPSGSHPACYSNVILSEDPETHHSLSLANTRILLESLVVTVMLCFVILIAERLNLKRKPKRRKTKWRWWRRSTKAFWLPSRSDRRRWRQSH